MSEVAWASPALPAPPITWPPAQARLKSPNPYAWPRPTRSAPAEIIAPAGFEKFFEELDAMGGALQAPPEELAALNGRYGLEMQPETIPGLLERFELVIGEPLEGGWIPASS